MEASAFRNNSRARNRLPHGAQGCWIFPIIPVMVALWAWFFIFGDAEAQATPPSREGTRYVLLTSGRSVQVLKSGATDWAAATNRMPLSPGDQVRTGPGSTARILHGTETVDTLKELSVLKVGGPANGESIFELLKGKLHRLHRSGSGGEKLGAGTVSASIRGTEFVMEREESGAVIFSVLEGELLVADATGTASIIGGESGVAGDGRPPRSTSMLEAQRRNAIQWVLYYPAILDPSDLPEAIDGQSKLAPVLDSYRRGDLGHALQLAEALEGPLGAPALLVRAMLRLCHGSIESARADLDLAAAEPRALSLVAAIREIMAATQLDFSRTPVIPPESGAGTTALLASSFSHQARGDLPPALEAARKAVSKSPAHGFGWARVAELEFSFGRTGAAAEAVERALQLSPSNSYAMTIQGFLKAAEWRFGEATTWFERAVLADSRFGQAWLGLGLVRIRLGDEAGAKAALLTAAACEPQRSLYRSYLGKMLADQGLEVEADKEFKRAMELDPRDPTPALYLGLLRQRQSRVADAVESMEKSVARNSSRQVVRSRMLLDQDSAVRRANLGAMYQEAGMARVAALESVKALVADPLNYSAHLNLAAGYQELRDPSRFDLRYETVWLNEHLLANLLAPADGSKLSQNLSQNEYAGLFVRNQIGIRSTTEYFGTGEWRGMTTHEGRFGRFAYALDWDMQRKAGVRVNNDLERDEVYGRFKFDFSPGDSLLILTKLQEYDSGDQFLRVNPYLGDPDFRFKEEQSPLLMMGWHHAWSERFRTLLLAGRLENEQEFSDLSRDVTGFYKGGEFDPFQEPFDLELKSRLEVYTGEAAQFVLGESFSTTIGTRFQKGEIESGSVLDGRRGVTGTRFEGMGGGTLERVSVYLYHQQKLVEGLYLIGGFAYDDLTWPLNYRNAPLELGERGMRRWSPKASLVYSPSAWVSWRAAYAESVGGVAYEDSFRLEPSQLAGFPQAFRSVASESVIGSVEAPLHQLAATGFDFRLPKNTFLGVEYSRLDSEADRHGGALAVDLADPFSPFSTSSYSEIYAYEENQIRMALNHVLNEEWFLGWSYRMVHSELDSNYPDIPTTPTYGRLERREADLQQLSGDLRFASKTGLRARVTGGWNWQDRQGALESGYSDFPHLNCQIGWQFRRRIAELTIGILNVTGHAPRLDPLNPFHEMPVERMGYVRLKLNLGNRGF